MSESVSDNGNLNNYIYIFILKNLKNDKSILDYLHCFDEKIKFLIKKPHLI